MQSHQLSIVDLFRLSLRIFKTKPIRTFLTILGMSVGIGTVVFLISLGYGLQFILIGKLVTSEDSLMTVGVAYPAENELNISHAEAEEISKLPDVEEISAAAEFPAEIRQASTTGLVIARIISPNYFRLSGVAPDIGAAFRGREAGVVLSNQAARMMNLPVDASILDSEVLLSVFYQNEKEEGTVEEATLTQPARIKGIVIDDNQPPFVFVPSDYLTKKPPFFKEVMAKGLSIDVVEGLRDKLLEKGYIITARVDLVNQARKVMNTVTMILGVFGVAALLVSAIGMFNTMIVGFLERIYEVGIMKSIGATDRDIKNLFLMEAFVMGFLGGGCGILLGIGGGKLFNFGLSFMAERLGGKAFDLFITPTWFALMTLGLSTLIGVISGFWPAHRASGLSPKEAFVRK